MRGKWLVILAASLLGAPGGGDDEGLVSDDGAVPGDGTPASDGAPASDGTDRDASEYVNLGTITTTGWKNYTVTSLVQDAWSNHAGVHRHILERYDGYTDENGRVHVSAKESTFYDWPHHLRITYTLADKTFETFIFDMNVVAGARRRHALVV